MGGKIESIQDVKEAVQQLVDQDSSIENIGKHIERDFPGVSVFVAAPQYFGDMLFVTLGEDGTQGYEREYRVWIERSPVKVYATQV